MFHLGFPPLAIFEDMQQSRTKATVANVVSTGTAMAAGVMLQNELPYCSLVSSSAYLATMSSGRSRRPTAKYTKVGERLRHVIPGHMQCSMACGGRACKYENPTRWSDQEQAVKGLYSSWITDNILAMSRPSTELIEKYNIIEQFQRCGIKTVINLQRPGEHASCGNPLEQESGFTYLPEAFMEAGSVLIACYLVFATRMTADQAILFVRAKRPNSIQTRGQLLCVREFSQFLIPLRNVFASCEPKAHAVTLSQYLIRQRHLLHGYESRNLKYVPKLIHLVCKLLLDLAENRHVIEEKLLDLPDLSAEIEETVSQLASTQLDKELTRQDSSASEPFSLSGANPLHPNEHECDPLWKRRNIDCLQPLGRAKRRLSYSDSDLRRAVFVCDQGETPWSVPVQMPLCNKTNPPNNCQTLKVDLTQELLVRSTFTFLCQDKTPLDGKEANSPFFHKSRYPGEVQRSQTFSSGLSCDRKEEEAEEDEEELKALNYNCGRKANSYGKKMWCSEDSDSSKAEPEIRNIRDLCESIPHIVVQSELSLEARRTLAAKALANVNEFIGAEEIEQKVEMWQKELNSQNGAWDRICGETDPFILSSLMWSWIEQLKEPLLTKNDVDVLAKNNVDPQEALKLLDKGKYHTILCILNCVVQLETIPTYVEDLLLDRAIKAFTKASSDSEGGLDILKNIFKQILEHQRQYSKDQTETLF
ncbi:protein tyrosine phosphatase domain-containing protein 1 isoform X3 [Zootoca vivipara]|uniref:protein tyrosine phosphatase domain-containing protein 1 isoform X3 n=1 Tax=Zootoca vivipara TaxID=8524 RepID=UPI00293BFBE0|nr:protein tyrosine phosphatase domain-containing protein 1 isoform X3 [Zootoca vivipara]